METTETKKRADKPVQLAIAKLPGRRYEEDKPRDCRYCYYWSGCTGASGKKKDITGSREGGNRKVKSKIVAAMDAAGYHFDELESSAACILC